MTDDKYDMTNRTGNSEDQGGADISQKPVAGAEEHPLAGAAENPLAGAAAPFIQADAVSALDEDGPIGLYDADIPVTAQRRAFRSGAVPVAVYGLGKMGLPVAAVLADVTGNVVGADIDDSVAKAVNNGRSHVTGEPGLDDLVAKTVSDGALRAVTDPRVAADAATVHLVIVPTLLTDHETADLSILEAVVDAIASGLSPGDIVLIESTVPPRTCRELVAPRLVTRSGIDSDRFGVAFCPERTSSGRALHDIQSAYPKIVGGVDAESTRVAELVYDAVTSNDVHAVRDATTAEATKVFGGVYRDVNIALANEFAQYADEMGIDVREAIDASNTQPYSHILSPGPGVGGHCIPVYPYFLLGEFSVHSPLVRVARSVNDAMPAHTVSRLRTALAAEAGMLGSDEGSTMAAGGWHRHTGWSVDAAPPALDDLSVLVLGVAYHPGVNETRNSPATEVIEECRRSGATVDICDPIVDDFSPFAGDPVSMAEAAQRAYDAVVICTPHEAFSSFAWDRLPPTVVLDCHDALDLDDTDHRVYTIGRSIDGLTRDDETTSGLGERAVGDSGESPPSDPGDEIGGSDDKVSGLTDGGAADGADADNDAADGADADSGVADSGTVDSDSSGGNNA